MSRPSFLCRLLSITANRDHFVRRLSVCLSDSQTFLVVTHSYVSQATHAFLGMLPLCWFIILGCIRNLHLFIMYTSISISWNFRSWEAIFHLARLWRFYLTTHKLFLWMLYSEGDFPMRFSCRDIYWNAWNRESLREIWGSYQTKWRPFSRIFFSSVIA